MLVLSVECTPNGSVLVEGELEEWLETPDSPCDFTTLNDSKFSQKLRGPFIAWGNKYQVLCGLKQTQLL
jgi:hypothetical protein